MRRLPVLTLLLATVAVGAAVPPVGAALTPTCESRHDCVVPDPRGDAFQGYERARRLTDLRAVRYVTPRSDDGRVRVRVTWPRLLDGTRGGRPQELGLTMTARDGRLWSVVVDNSGDLEAYRLRAGAEDVVRVPDPDDWSVSVRPGKDGRPGVLDVAFSTEWIPVSRARFDTWAETGYARDEVRPTPPLAIGR